MARKGEVKSEKTLAASRVIPVHRKKKVWQVKAKPGPHKKKNSAALGFVLRNIIGLTKNARETKNILNNNMVMVDRKTVKDPKRPVGLFDLITITTEKKTYRILFSKKGKLTAEEEEPGQKQKICKVTGKQAIAKKEIRITTNDGRTLKIKNQEAKVGDSVLIEVPGQKIIKILKQVPNKTVLVVDGKHVGDVAKVKDIVQGTMSRPKLVTLETKDGEFKTVESNIVIVGDDKPVIKVE